VSGELYTEEQKEGKHSVQNFGRNVRKSLRTRVTGASLGPPGGRLAYVHEDIIPTDLNRLAIHAQTGVIDNLASCDVVRPGVPGTRDNLALKLAFTQGTGLVYAYAIDSMELTGDVCDCDGLFSHLEFIDFTHRDIVFPPLISPSGPFQPLLNGLLKKSAF
jgi:hypothetical protein